MKPLLLLLAVFAFNIHSTFAKPTREVHLKWLHTSDVHGSLFRHNYLQNRAARGGLSSIYGYAQILRQTYGDRLVMTDGGDCLQGQPTAYYYNFVKTDVPHLVTEVMNEMGYVCGTIGNHDVETGHEVYDRWVSQCKHPVLGANVIDTRTGKPYLTPYIVIEREGVKVAILGLLTAAIPNWLPERLWAGLRFEDMERSARKWMKTIREKEHPDLVVGLFHSGFDGGIVTPEYRENATRQVACEVPGFDLICYGHDHQAAVHELTNCEGQKVVVMGPTSQGRRVAEADIVVRKDARGRVVEKRITASVPFVDAEKDSASNNHELQTYARDFESRFAQQHLQLLAWLERPIGVLTRPIWERDAFFGSSEFIDLIQQMQLELTGADISFAAPLSFDARLRADTLRVRDMFALYKYENLLYTMRLSGQEVKDFLEMSYGLWTNQMTSPDDHIMLLDSILDNGRRQGLKNLSYNMDAAAGILYTVDVTKPVGQRVNISSMADGTPFDLQRDYRVAINSYRGNGGGELLTKGAGIAHSELKSRILSSTEKDLRYYLMQHIIEQYTIVPKKLNQWRFVPEEWTGPAIKRDRAILFPNRDYQ